MTRCPRSDGDKALIRLGQSREAVDFVRALVSQDPHYSAYHIVLTIAYIQEGKFTEAVTAAEQLNDPQSGYGLGIRSLAFATAEAICERGQISSGKWIG